MGEWLKSLVPWGTEAIVWVQSLNNPILEAAFKVLTYLGNEAFYFLLLPIVYWCLDRRVGVALGYLAMLSAWVNSLAKYLFRIPRPGTFDSRIRVLVKETSPSFPSGHSQNAVANWGFFAVRFRRWGFWLVAILIMLGIGLSRIVLGVHFPQDVIGGWLIGMVLLVIYVWAGAPVVRWVARQRAVVQLALAVAFPVSLIFLHPAGGEGLYPAKKALTPASALVGVGVGLIMERRWVRFRVDGKWWRRGLRYLVGLVIVSILYIGPRFLLPEEMAYGLEAGVHFVRYALVCWAATFLCPWLFVRLDLAEQEGSPLPVS